jgi:hypothetical protein
VGLFYERKNAQIEWKIYVLQRREEEMKLYRDEGENGQIYARMGTSVQRWNRSAVGWIAERAELPATAQPLEFAELPADLREEVLAAAVRAQAIGVGSGSAMN